MVLSKSLMLMLQNMFFTGVINMIKKKFGTVLKNIRLGKKMSLREFSKHIGISHAYVNKLENGYNEKTKKEIMPTIETLIKISDALDIPLNKFLYMCGYLEENYEFDTKEFDKSLSQNVIDIKQYVKEIISNLKNAKFVTYNGKSLNKKDIDTISQALKIGMQMSKKAK